MNSKTKRKTIIIIITLQIGFGFQIHFIDQIHFFAN